jgi:hypothetical protein
MGYKIYFFRIFRIFFGPQNSQKQLNLYSNSQIYIQMIKFKFKWTGQQTTPHYRPLVPVVSGSAGG